MIIANRMQFSEIGMIGLGVMGRNFLLNLAGHGFPAAGYDKDIKKVEALRSETKELDIQSVSNINEFISTLSKPRAIIMLVPAGDPVDSVIHDLLPHLESGDLIIDAGNSYYKDTELRTIKLSKQGIQFMGVGISGGEEGARNGPSIMPGGSREAYERIRPIFEAASAKFDNVPCVTYLGTGSSGHFVKMIHNGIEYAIMQLISETYDIMKRGLGFNDDQLNDIYSEWNKGDANCYLLDITSQIFSKNDENTGKRLIDEILDVARQKGTGMWTSQSAMELQVPIPTIDMAVMMRDLSMFELLREEAENIFVRPVNHINLDTKIILKQLRNAFYSGMIIAYAQGMSVLTIASEKYNFNIEMESVARIWRGGCIIRALLLEDIRKAYLTKPDLQNLLLDQNISRKINENQEDLRSIVCKAAEIGVPVPALMASLSYLDALRSSWLPANLIQAQRDYFGAHTYERVDAKGTFHTEWIKK
jgi:6-phosphogluconate dehydrogenase